MKIICISDTHGAHDRIDIPNGDVLIHAGDFTPNENISCFINFVKWMMKQPHKHKIVIAGNHEFIAEQNHGYVKEAFENAGVIYLNDSGTTIDGIKFWGSPISLEFNDWAFNRKRGLEIARHWDMIPNDTNILITHGPPYKILDFIPNIVCNYRTGKFRTVKRHEGCKDLKVAILNRIKPKFHIFGHIHESYGRVKKDGTTFINCSIMNGVYRPANKCKVVRI